MSTPTLKTLPFSCAAQIAQDIRIDFAAKEWTLPLRIDRTLEATIDAVLAVERAKIERLVKASEDALADLIAMDARLLAAPQPHPVTKAFKLNPASEGEKGSVTELRAALFNLQA